MRNFVFIIAIPAIPLKKSIKAGGTGTGLDMLVSSKAVPATIQVSSAFSDEKSRTRIKVSPNSAIAEPPVASSKISKPIL